MAFDMSESKNYERWFLTPAGMYVDDKEKELLINTMRFRRGERVLEIGAGTGRYMEYLQALGLDVTGIEPMQEYVKIAAQKEAIDPSKILIGSYEKLPFGDNSFNSAFFAISFEFARDKVQALREALRVASEKVGIGFLNKYSLPNLIKAKERRKVFKNVEMQSHKDMWGIAAIALEGMRDKVEITVKNTLYMPVNIGHLAPVIDDILERTNLPFGNYAMMVIRKKKKRGLK